MRFLFLIVGGKIPPTDLGVFNFSLNMIEYIQVKNDLLLQKLNMDKDKTMKTLYVSDLDGTLLRNDQKLSQYTIEVINKLVEKGEYFSYATARSYHTSSIVTEGLKARIPVIVYTGTMIIDNSTGEVLTSHRFGEDDTELLAKMMESDVYPIVYSYINGKERFAYLPDKCNDGMRKFLNTRNDGRERKIETVEELCEGDIFHYVCIDKKEKLEPLYEKIKNEYPCVFYLDFYTNEYWIEIMPKGVSKASAIRELKEQLGCDKLVVFGDGKNDIAMFEIADEAYAVANAEEELKTIATAVIGGNNEDGVAKWLDAHLKTIKENVGDGL